MTPTISILLPHLRDTENDLALKICLDCLVSNTGVDFELLIESVSARRDIYAVLNEMAGRAIGDYIIPHNSDVFVSPGWIEPLLALADPSTIVSPIMVECGAIGVHTLNYEMDFGKTPQSFRRAEFEAWVAAGGEWRDGERAWYFPSLLHRETFCSVGGFDTTRGVFPLDPVDAYFWDMWAESGRGFRRARSWVYHLQNYSSEFEQQKRR